ncbi:MAG: aspartate carbamoyltransferase [Candidatus Saccharimonadales bacterium]
MHVLAAHQFNPEQIGAIFEKADEFHGQLQTAEGRRELASLHLGEQVCSTFYESSTRTKASFELGALKMGMQVFETENAAEFSSISKGETIEDTIRVLGSYGVAAIILRTKKEGEAARAASVSQVPIINAGDGKAEHPTQSLLDAYTIQKEIGRLDNLRVVMGGDLKHGRTVRSLSQLLAKYPQNHIAFVSHPEFRMGDDIKAILDEHDTTYDETSEMYDPLHDADVVYWTRSQTERHDDQDSPADGEFVIDTVALEAMNKDAIIMHPLPRVGEITLAVDSDPRAKYFIQAENGLYIRMALLDQAVSVVRQ